MNSSQLNGFSYVCEAPSDEDKHLLVLHGTGGNESDLLPLASALAPGWGLLSPRGRVLENGMPRFFKRLAEGVFDLQDLAVRTRELAEFVEAASKQHNIKGSLMALGYSNGANIAASLLLTDPQHLSGAVLLRPMIPFEPDGMVNLEGKRILIVSGLMDPICPPHHAAKLQELFGKRGAEVDVELLSASHGLGQEDVEIAANWLASVS